MPLRDSLCGLLGLFLLVSLLGCSGGHSMRTIAMRSALDAGRLDAAVTALNKELGVASGEEVPTKLVNDDALLVLDRATIHQSLARFGNSKRDYEAADKAMDVLDLSRGTPDEIADWVFSESAGRYVAPPHEKLLINTLNMLNYLETHDLSGARVEARRMVVTSRYLRERDRQRDPTLGLGSLLAGFTYEKSGDDEEARRFYADAGQADALLVSDLLARRADVPEGHGEILVVIGSGRVPHRVANHVMIGEALARSASFLEPDDHAAANRLALKGLVTWVNYPSLAPSRSRGQEPTLAVDGQRVDLTLALDCEGAVRSAWSKIEGEVMAAAVSRTIARAAAGVAVEEVSKGLGKTSKKKDVQQGAAAVGTILSLIVQAAMTAADVPDTRSWETMPARLSVARIVVPAGEHMVVMETGGFRREGRTRVTPGGFAVLSLMSLR